MSWSNTNIGQVEKQIDSSQIETQNLLEEYEHQSKQQVPSSPQESASEGPRHSQRSRVPTEKMIAFQKEKSEKRRERFSLAIIIGKRRLEMLMSVSNQTYLTLN